jgi:hypothetical protein
MPTRRAFGALVVMLMLAPASACNAFGSSDKPAADGIISGTPTTLSSAATQPSSITTDAMNVYWGDKGANTVMTVPKTAGGMARTLAMNTEQPDNLASIDDNVYWLETRSGCPGHNHLLVQAKDSTGAPQAIWGNDTNCYTTWRMATGPGLFYVQQDSTIVQVSIMTHARTALAMNENIVSGIAGDGTAVYWTGMNVIKMVPQPSGGVSTFVGNLKDPTELAVDADAVYWVDRGDGAIRKLERAKANTVPTDLATGFMTSGTAAFRLALDNDTVYWTSRDEGTVKAVPKAGGQVRTLAMGEAGPFAIAVDNDGLYWGNLGDHTIRLIHR